MKTLLNTDVTITKVMTTDVMQATSSAPATRSCVSYSSNPSAPVRLRPVTCDTTTGVPVFTVSTRPVMAPAFICADAATVNPTMATAGATPTNWFAGLKHEFQRLKERSLT